MAESVQTHEGSPISWVIGAEARQQNLCDASFHSFSVFLAYAWLMQIKTTLAFILAALAGSSAAGPARDDVRRRRGVVTTALEPIQLPPVSTPALAAGALAIGALAVGALAIGALAIGRLEIRQARFRKLEIDDLTVRKLRIIEENAEEAKE